MSWWWWYRPRRCIFHWLSVLHSLILICMITSSRSKIVFSCCCEMYCFGCGMDVCLYVYWFIHGFHNSFTTTVVNGLWWIFMRINSIYVYNHYSVHLVKTHEMKYIFLSWCNELFFLYWWRFIRMLIMMRGKFQPYQIFTTTRSCCMSFLLFVVETSSYVLQYVTKYFD